MISFSQMQDEIFEWAQRNFHKDGDDKPRPNYHPLLGALEELGELAHAHLKLEQGIRGSEKNHRDEAMDAIGDIVIFLMDYCNLNGYNFEPIVEDTWVKVKQRDWKHDNQNGG